MEEVPPKLGSSERPHQLALCPAELFAEMLNESKLDVEMVGITAHSSVSWKSVGRIE